MELDTTAGIIIVDHGSRRGESNRMLEEVAGLFARRFAERYGIVEPAHMELAEPSIATAYAACVRRGAQRVVVCPFFLGPGKHWTSDIPRLTAEAARQFPESRYHVTMPLGIDDLILDLLEKRVRFCTGHEYACESCRGTARSGEPGIAGVESSASHAPHAAVEGAPVVCSTCPYKGAALPAAAAAR